MRRDGDERRLHPSQMPRILTVKVVFARKIDGIFFIKILFGIFKIRIESQTRRIEPGNRRIECSFRRIASEVDA